MQSEFDKEIDSLLRESVRRGRVAPATPLEWGARGREADGGGDLLRAMPSGAHLDADERNAYAENSLPPAARTHYAAHLADCDDCRRSVTQLALAAGTPAQLEQRAAATGVEVLPGVTWRERLGALFAPRAWRYAVPALALLLVGAVALMVSMRGTQQRDVSVAEQRNSAPDKTKIALPESHHAQQNNDAAAGTEGTSSTSNSNAPSMREEVATVAREDQEQAKSVRVLTDDDAAPPPPAPVTSGAGAATVTAPAAANIPQPMPTPEPVPEEVIVRQDAEQKNKVSERTEEFAKDVQKPGNYETNQSRERERISGPRRNNSEQTRNMQRGVNVGAARDGVDKNNIALATSTPVPPAATARRPKSQPEVDEARSARASDDSKKGEGVAALKSTGETRTVAGRKFRRSGSAWIDTAYNSSQAVTVVRRNSEQYRALIADEPTLRRISDALGGEVTVVWRGRAYRIR